MIRLAYFQDIPEIIKMADEARSISRYGPTTSMDADHARRIAMECIASHFTRFDGGAVFVAVGPGGYQGFFTGVVRPFYECLNLAMATNLLWYTRKGAPGRVALELVEAFEQWAEQGPAPMIYRMAVSDAICEPEKVGRLLARRGYRQSGLIFEKEN